MPGSFRGARARSEGDALSSNHFAACSGSNEPSAALLTDTRPIKPGAKCEAGRTEARLGSDTNGDGVLGSEEITSSYNACNAVEAAPSLTTRRAATSTECEDACAPLIRVTVVSAGQGCDAGGLLITVGHDTAWTWMLPQAEPEAPAMPKVATDMPREIWPS